ncbi:MAG TPA: hypothetical protein VMS60_05430 [Solirubrobacterales bacterium]|nr:hypothetical protein [Solirubrobacterales bacterium]
MRREGLLYWNNFAEKSVAFADIAGGGGGPLNLAGVAITNPEGLAYDSATGRLLVANESGGPGGDGQIVAVNVDGSGAAVFSAPGAPVSFPSGIAVDPIARIAYWTNGGVDSIAWARLDGSAGGTLNNTGGDDLNIDGATPSEGIRAFSVDPAAGRIYWIGSERSGISYATLNGSGGDDLDIDRALFTDPFGFAFDPDAGRFYWGNAASGRTGAFGFANLGGGGGGINIATAPVDEAQDPVILKSPTGTAAPLVTRSAKSRTALTCSQGSWAPDFAGSYVYRAPSKFAYQWMRDGQPLAGATASTLNATDPGAYTCTVSASNEAGAATQSSAAVPINPAQLKLTLKCKKLGPIPGGAGITGTLRLKVGAVASGTYTVTLTVKGAPAKAARAKIVVK